MATLGELLHAIPVKLLVLGAETGLGREVRRVKRVQQSSQFDLSLGPGDLIVYEAAGNLVPGDQAIVRALMALSSTSVAGIVCDLRSKARGEEFIKALKAPLLVRPPEVAADAISEMFEHAVDVHASRLTVLQAEIQRDLANLTRSGASAAMVLDRLVETTGNSGVLQREDAHVEHVRLATGMDLSELRQAMHASDLAVQHSIRDADDPTLANVLYLELPHQNLIRLVAPLRLDGRMQQHWLSLFARPANLTAGDRARLIAAGRALSVSNPTTTDPEISLKLRGWPAVAALVLRAVSAEPERLAQALEQNLEPGGAVVRAAASDVRAWFSYESADEGQRRIARWHAELSKQFDAVSAGYVFRKGSGAQDAHHAIVQAAEALLIGERVFGAGHLTSYAEAQIATHLVGRDKRELQTMYERSVGKLLADSASRDSDLVKTLEVYCQTFATLRTAEHLGVHRNTVLYRLKRIEEITAADLEDGATRLSFQLGLLAGRVLRRTGAVSGVSVVAA